MGKIKVGVDAGHGSDTYGKRTAPFTKNVDIDKDGKIDIKKGEQYREHYANVGVANLLYNKLIKRGYDVIKTGWNDENAKDDVDESLTSRQNKIKNYGCDYSISIHFNAYGDGKTFNSAKGVGVYIHDKYAEDSKNLAQFVLNELVKGTKQTNRGISTQALSLCNCKTMKTKASILVELAFMTNEYEAQELMANSDFWEECAEEIANGFDNYLKSKGIKIDIDKEKPKNVDKEDIHYMIHTVKKGEYLSKIASQYNTTVDKLVKVNNIKNANLINVGDKLKVVAYTLYTVKRGDTLSKIAKNLLGKSNRYKEIKELNGFDDDIIFIDQVIMIPHELV